MKYKIMSAEMDDKGFVVIPEQAIVLGGLYHPITGKFVVACMILVEEPLKKDETEEQTSGKEE